MNPIWIPVTFVIVLAAWWGISNERKRRSSLATYWDDRSCSGRAWRRAFPSASNDSIREFLYLVVDAFGFERSRALHLSPSDTIFGLYRAAYPDATTPDALELETLRHSLERRYGASRLVNLPGDLTFGDLFGRVAVA